jgi:hypothetical protein
MADSSRSERAKRAWETRRIKNAFIKVRASEAASKEALKGHLEKLGWQVVFFEGKSRSPRTGIIDAFAYRLSRKNADLLEIKLIQLKGGKAGASGREIARLKQAVDSAALTWAVASFDGEAIHLTSEESGSRLK